MGSGSTVPAQERLITQFGGECMCEEGREKRVGERVGEGMFEHFGVNACVCMYMYMYVLCFPKKLMSYCKQSGKMDIQCTE